MRKKRRKKDNRQLISSRQAKQEKTFNVLCQQYREFRAYRPRRQPLLAFDMNPRSWDHTTEIIAKTHSANEVGLSKNTKPFQRIPPIQKNERMRRKPDKAANEKSAVPGRTEL